MATTTTMPPVTTGFFGDKKLYGHRMVVTSIEFDWEVDDDEFNIPDTEKKQVIDDVMSGEWLVTTIDDDWDEETYATHLQDLIEDSTGWLVDNFTYEFVVDDCNA